MVKSNTKPSNLGLREWASEVCYTPWEVLQRTDSYIFHLCGIKVAKRITKHMKTTVLSCERFDFIIETSSFSLQQGLIWLPGFQLSPPSVTRGVRVSGMRRFHHDTPLIHFIWFFFLKNHDNSRDTSFKKTSIHKKSLKIATRVYLCFNGDSFYLIGHDHISSQYINKEHTLKKNFVKIHLTS